jgi:hypothetical protein
MNDGKDPPLRRLARLLCSQEPPKFLDVAEAAAQATPVNQPTIFGDPHSAE